MNIIEADLGRPDHARALVALLDEYARGATGTGQPLSGHARSHLAAELARRPQAHVLLAYAGAQAVALAVCFEGFSTFACRPLLNIHDIVVTESHRGRGAARALLLQAEALARRLGCCKLTLEVLEGNRAAQALYRSCGYDGYELNPATGRALFWQKKLEG